jgi:hypothetical protein
MANLSHIRSKQDLIVALIPQAADAVHPHGPRGVTNAFVDLLIADVIKEISTGLAEASLKERAFGVSKKMASQASESLVASWEPGDDICPPWKIRWPGPRPGRFDPYPNPWKLMAVEVFGPQPEPWKPVGAAVQIELAHALTQLAGLTTSKEFNVQLKSLATEVARGVASRLADDFERCGTVPRKPLPRPPGPRGGE